MPEDEKQDDAKGTNDGNSKEGAKDSDSKQKTDSDDDEQVTMSKKELQSFVDSRVTGALDTQKQKTEKQQAEKDVADKKDRLESEGKFKELSEQQSAQISEFQDREKNRKFEDDAREKLEELSLEEFAGVLIGHAGHDMAKLELDAKKIDELVNAKVEARVSERLNTGDDKRVVKGKGEGSAGSKKVSEWSDDERLKFIEESGAEAYQEKLDAEYAHA